MHWRAVSKVSGSEIDVVLQISGMFDLATGILNSNPNWYFYRLFTWRPQWIFYALVGFLAKVAPVRSDKILAVESSVVDWRDVHEEQVSDASWHVNDELDFQEALAVIRQNNCDDALTSLKAPEVQK